MLKILLVLTIGMGVAVSAGIASPMETAAPDPANVALPSADAPDQVPATVLNDTNAQDPLPPSSTPVPEPPGITLGILGGLLIAIGFMRKKRRAR